MQVHYDGTASSREAIALPQRRKPGLGEPRSVGRSTRVPTPSLVSARREVLSGFEWENYVWAALAASALVLLAASLMG
jgi:hypothetical protein